MDSIGRILALFFLSSLLVLRCRAGHAFNWGFGPNFVQTSFRECDTRGLTVITLNESTTDLGVPPYYMMEFAVGGGTFVSSIGDNPKQLSWRVNSPKGSKVLLTVIDSVGNTGGFSSNFFDIVAGDKSCQAPAPSNPATVSANVTTTINTCDSWGLTITGGVKPYNVTLAAVASPVMTNVSMGPEDDFFTFIDRADPGTQLLAAVVDATGQWGISSLAVKTAGSTDTSCLGRVSTSTTREQIQAQAVAAAAAAASSAKAKSRAIALGVVFGLVVPLILAAVAFWYWWRRRRQLAESRARPFDGGGSGSMQERAVERPSLNLDTNVVRVDAQLRRSPSWMVDSNRAPVRQTDSPTSIDMTSTDLRPSTAPTPFLTSPQVQSTAPSAVRSPASQILPSAVSMTMSPLVAPEPAYTPTPNSTSPAATLSPEQRYRKMLEAHAEAQAARARYAAAAAASSSSAASSSYSYSLGGSSALAGPSSRPLVQRSQSEAVRTVSRFFPSQPVPRRAGSSLRMPPVGTIPEVGPDIIIQHRDGGNIVEELPPPYPADGPGSGPSSPPPPPSTRTPPRRIGVGVSPSPRRSASSSVLMVVGAP
ncbi:hypothetical protein C8Q74DRAFT_1363546 [Fomes fomentarius]|nr:hypothetical protein C8Q74DRAFT_1363546 [Fomes fomentarius]